MSPVPDVVVELVERFQHNRDYYHRPDYNETQVRREFIDPLFEALGWDVANKRGVAPQYQEVIHEASVRVRGSVHAPDYCFRVGREPKFFVEAKKPAVDIRADIHPAYQLRRYAWSAKLPLSILTDFEEFSVYDCRIRPKPGDKAGVARILYVNYEEYPDRWGEIAEIFAREAVWRGDYDRYAESTRKKRGTLEVDDAFLAEIEGWRELLARNLALRNPTLSRRDLNYAVQKIIDRIIFLRICEDRGIEPYEGLRDALSGGNVYERLLERFRRADARYNSGLFHFSEERGRNEPPDTLTPTLRVDDKVLAQIIGGLYYPESPYEFSVISHDILGNVYERFLGSVIRLTAGHRAVVEQKPEVRKAGGVYYTPKYIVDYIVEHTVGELVKDKTPGQIANLRILDPACGSGSFLLGAYDYLLRYHLDWYVNHPTKNPRKEIYQTAGGEWRLTIAEKKRILLNNIYGVDIDPQAVEVTKLSLLLKVLEGETEATLQPALLPERALPDLSDNIKCGNSLIGPDFYEGQQLAFLDEEEMWRVNPFDWEAEFPEIMAAGGFDAVIGNPPYLSYSGRQAIDLEQSARDYLFSHYNSTTWPTSHGFFIERAVNCLSRRFTSYIVPDQVGHLAGYEIVRRTLCQHGALRDVRYWGENVFEGVVTPALTFVADKAYAGMTRISSAVDGNERTTICEGGDPWHISQASEMLKRFNAVCGSLGALVADPGVHTGNCSKKLVLKTTESIPGTVPVLEGKQIGRYSCAVPTKRLRLDYVAQGREYFTIRPESRYSAARFVIRQTAPYPIVGPRMYATYFRNSLLALYSPDDQTDVHYLVGILNSRLIRYLYTETVRESRQKAFPQVKVRSLRDLPIRTIDFSDPADVARHDRMVSLVERMLALHKELAAAKTPTQKTLLQRQIEATDKQIDRLVYELYELTEEEIAIVEGNA